MKKHIFKIIGIVVFINILSVMTIYNILPKIASTSPVDDPKIFVIKQTIGIIAGLVIIFGLYHVNLEKVRPYINFVYFIFVGMLAILAFNPPIIGDIFVENINGANGWFNLIPGVITIHPAEFMRFVLMFKMAEIGVGHYHSTRKDIKLVYDYIVWAGVPIFLIMLQPDLGMALMNALPMLVLFLASIKEKKFLMKILTLLTLTAIVGIFLLITPWGHEVLIKFTPIEAYQLERLNAWLDPFNTDKGYQLQQSLTIIGSSEPIGDLTPSPIHFPESHTDFIYAEFVALFGWIMGIVLIVLYGILMIDFLSIALKVKSKFYSLLIIAVTAMFFFQIAENIGMVIGLFPVTGVVLPFMSYGVSAMLTFMALVGVVINSSKQMPKE
jgi:cell division protein FtsW (lipid II flippase)